MNTKQKLKQIKKQTDSQTYEAIIEVVSELRQEAEAAKADCAKVIAEAEQEKQQHKVQLETEYADDIHSLKKQTIELGKKLRKAQRERQEALAAIEAEKLKPAILSEEQVTELWEHFDSIECAVVDIGEIVESAPGVPLEHGELPTPDLDITQEQKLVVAAWQRWMLHTQFEMLGYKLEQETLSKSDKDQ